MKVNSRVRDGVMIVSVSGRVLLPRTDVFAAWVKSEVGERLDGAVVLECARMTYINSAGFREILMLARRMGEHGGRLALCGLSPQIRRTFEVVGFDRVLDICETLEDALKAVSDPSATDEVCNT